MKKLLPALCSTLMLSLPLLAHAQPGPGDNNQGQGQEQQQGQQHGNQGQGQQAQQHGNQGNQGQGNQGNRQANNGGHGAPSPHQDWHSGRQAPAAYRGQQYQVSDWQSHNLRRPPANHRWLHVNGDYVLVSIATGVISQIVTGH